MDDKVQEPDVPEVADQRSKQDAYENYEAGDSECAQEKLVTVDAHSGFRGSDQVFPFGNEATRTEK